MHTNTFERITLREYLGKSKSQDQRLEHLRATVYVDIGGVLREGFIALVGDDTYFETHLQRDLIHSAQNSVMLPIELDTEVLVHIGHVDRIVIK